MDSQKRAHILLVDDEPALIKVLHTYLSRIGYTVDAALNATEAFALFDSGPQRYDLLVADLTLPGVQGDEMALQMVERSPKLRVLLCSGYPFTVDSLPAAVQSRFGSLQKPFLPNMLAKMVEDLLQHQT